jgi:ribosomal protein L31
VTDQSIAADTMKESIQQQSAEVVVTDQSVDFESRTTTTINEEIRTIEHAPILF